MKISRKSRYGLRAMVELGLYYKKGPISARVVSKAQSVPLQYLEQIFNRLKKKALIKALRGPRGGYSLSKDPKKISIKSILDALEDNNSLTDCLKNEKRPCKRLEDCGTKFFWQKLDKAINKVLVTTTLYDLCQKTPKKKKDSNINHSYPFQI